LEENLFGKKDFSPNPLSQKLSVLLLSWLLPLIGATAMRTSRQ
jgi:hypothetical protein